MRIESKIRERASKLGFDLFGVADTHVDEKEVLFFRKWIDDGMAAGMSGWLDRGTEKRANPDVILPGVKSVIVLGINYFPGDHSSSNKIARYAWGDDYHDWIGEKLRELCNFLSEIDTCDSKYYVDTGAVFERYFAQKAGLGFIGKNTCLITPEFGSWVFIGTILTTLELEPTAPIKNVGCGDCTRCIDACPTGALTEKCVDSRKCISYLTIERKGGFSEEEEALVSGQEFCFGCDRCQEVCPHNTRAKKCQVIGKKIESLSLADLPVSKKSPLNRAKLAGLKRNLEVVNQAS